MCQRQHKYLTHIAFFVQQKDTLCPTDRYTVPLYLKLSRNKMLFLLSAFQSCWEFVGFFWWFLFVCFVLKVKHISICTLSSILTSSSSKRPVPPLKRPPLEPNGVKSSSVSLGGLKMSSSSSRKQKRQES